MTDETTTPEPDETETTDPAEPTEEPAAEPEEGDGSEGETLVDPGDPAGEASEVEPD